jgi:hypothetical protein
MKQKIELNELKRHRYMKHSMMDISVEYFLQTKFIDGRDSLAALTISIKTKL